MEKVVLSAKERDTAFLGKKSKNLRKRGILPATIYGSGMKPLSLQIKENEIVGLLRKGSNLGLIDLKIEGEENKRPVVIQALQKGPVWGNLLNLEFLQVDLNKKISAKIPLVFIGTPLAVKEGRGVLLSLVDEVEVEGLPESLPDKFEVAVDQLSQIDQSLKVSDIVFNSDLTLKTSLEELICKISAQQKEEEVAASAPAVPLLDEEAKEEETAGKEIREG